MGNRLILKRKPQVRKLLDAIEIAQRATSDERNRIIKILSLDKAKVSQAAMLAIAEGKKYDRG